MGVERFTFRRGLVAVAFLISISMLVPAQVNAGFSLGDAANYAVLFEGAGNNHLSINNGTIVGNVGLGDPPGGTPQAQLNSPLTINGNIQFAGSVNTSIGNGVVVTGSITASNANVQTDLNNLNALSSTLSNEPGFSVAISIANNATQIVNAASGTLDGNGNRVFSLSSLAFVNGATLVINGDGAGDSVVFNIGFDASFGGTIVLTGGLTSDKVLFNILGGANLTGGHALTVSTSGATETGTFLDPNGAMQINHSVLNGRFFGGDTHDDQIVSGIDTVAPVPEPSSYALVFFGVVGAIGVLRRR